VDLARFVVDAVVLVVMSSGLATSPPSRITMSSRMMDAYVTSVLDQHAVTGDEVEVPYQFPDRATPERALFAIAPVYGIEQDQQLVGKTIESRAEPYRRPDGSYRFENRFGYVIAMAP
jgi:hypothetical protein